MPLYGQFTIELLLSVLGDCVQILTLIQATAIVTWVYKKPSNTASLLAIKPRLIGLLLSSSCSNFTLDQELMTPWKELNLEHCVFGKRLPTMFHKFKEVWKCLYELGMWSIRIDRNNQVFNKKKDKVCNLFGWEFWSMLELSKARSFISFNFVPLKLNRKFFKVETNNGPPTPPSIPKMISTLDGATGYLMSMYVIGW